MVSMDLDLPAVDSLAGNPTLPPPADLPAPRPTALERGIALLQVVLCSDFPTQILVGQALLATGFGPTKPGEPLGIGFVGALSLIDTAMLVGLIVLFIRAGGDSQRRIFLGGRPFWPEVWKGLPLTFVAFALAAISMLTIRWLVPSLHDVERNPLQDLTTSPLDAALFAIVVVIAGGVREELQRAFLLDRFERWLGGRWVGVAVTSVAFGAGHRIQGIDAVVATGVLGAFWAVVYLRRRSVVAPMISHSGFNLLQLLQLLALKR